MNARWTSWLIPLAVLNAGCSLVSDSVHVIGYRAERAVNDAREEHRDRHLAAEVWAELRRSNPGFSENYADGFKAGFVAHLFRGTCEPPPLAPAQYRTVRNQTPEGYRAAEQWLTGFRHGVAEAHSRGLRELVTGPSALRTVPRDPPVPVTLEHQVPVPPATPLPPPTPLLPVESVVAPATALIRGSAPEPHDPSVPDRPPPTPTPLRTSTPVVVAREPEAPVPVPPAPRVTMRALVQVRLLIVAPTVGLMAEGAKGSERPERIESEASLPWSAAPSSDREETGAIWLRSGDAGPPEPVGDAHCAPGRAARN